MATIKSQMVLNDGMSAVLKKITAALEATLTCFEKVQEASGQAFDIDLIQRAHTQIAQANSGIQEMEQQFNRAAQAEEKLNQNTQKGTSALKDMAEKAASLAKRFIKLPEVKDVISDSLSAADVQIGAQVRLKAVMGNAGLPDYYDQVLEKASEIQGRGIFGDEVMIAGAAEFAAYFSDGEAILSMMDTLTDYAAGMSSGKEVDAASMAEYAAGLGKIMSGSYDAMTKKNLEFTDTQKAIIEGSATEAQIVAELGGEYLGMSQDMQAAAVIGDVIAERWGGLYETMSNTPAGQLTQLNNALGHIKENVGAGIYPAVLNFVDVIQSNLPQIEAAAMGFATALGIIITIITGLVEGAMAVGTVVADNWSWIEPIVWGVVAALIAYNATQGVAWLTTLKDIAVKGAHAVASAGETLAILALIAAQNGLNAAIAACPITWIIIAIIALITIIVAVIRALDVWGASTHSVLGTITGLFAVALAFIGNILVGLVNFGIDVFAVLWNFIAAFANFFGNVFNDPVGAIARLFFDLVDVILSLLQALASAIDTLFGSNLAGAVQGWRDSLSGWVDDTFGQGEEFMPVINSEEYHLDRFVYEEAFEAGANWGDGLSEQLSGLFEPGSIEDYIDEGPGASSMMDGLGNDVEEIADNTGGMAGALEVSGEELKYLRDIAERDAINRFTTAEVKIDMTGMTNKIDGGTDLDGVIRELTDGFSEALVTAAEGVHK